MYNPIATYRLQFHKEFTFDDCEAIIKYLQKLGVSTIYASPVFEATPGSTHGYDVVNPHNINPEAGTEDQLRRIISELAANNMGWIQDIVPNHMAYHQRNAMLQDVLAKGSESAHASFFDMTGNSELFEGSLMVPVLDASLETTIKTGKLQLTFNDNHFALKYSDNLFPLNKASSQEILDSAKQQGINITSAVKEINKDPLLLYAIADNQYYRLCHWQETNRSINYRRFFTVNGLICLNMQDDAVFETYHRLIARLTKEGSFKGLRIDHIDGLYDPEKYLQQLKKMAGPEVYIVAEKILERKEILPAQWPIEGTTGYDFLAIVNNLFTNKASENKLTRFYTKLINDKRTIEEQLYQKKTLILNEHMSGELENLYRLFVNQRLTDDHDVQEIKNVIAALLIHCPVYRYYGNSFPLTEQEATALQNIFKKLRDDKTQSPEAVALVENALLQKTQAGDKEYNNRALIFYQRCMQFSGPLMAKGMEDTLMYTYNRFIGHNEVGDSPESFGIAMEIFHDMMIIRQRQWPMTMNATATHDTKRGEDARARLNVLTELPDEWLRMVRKWIKMNKGLKINGIPGPNEEYLIYQTLTGAYPMPGVDDNTFTERFEQYLIKALREAKIHTGWNDPDKEYEDNTIKFALALLDRQHSFRDSFISWQQEITDFGIINSLSQLILKCSCPGIPDIYQGTELWDLSFVDPDNRRAVDYSLRQKLMRQYGIGEQPPSPATISQLWHDRYNGAIKLWLTQLLLTLRKQHSKLFLEGSYVPLEVKGKYRKHVMAFARRYKHTWLVIAVPVHFALLCKKTGKAITDITWEDTRIILPPEAPASWEHLSFPKKGKCNGAIQVSEVMEQLPFAILLLQHSSIDRGAGVLLHITSLPSPFGMGDLGPEAEKFAVFLSRSGQKIWQLLPLSPTDETCGFSPYSSSSSMALNLMLLSPELMAQEGLIDASKLEKHYLPFTDKADFKTAYALKEKLLDDAFEVFKKGNFPLLLQQFEAFCRDEAYWLDDFAFYTTLKQKYNETPWYEWPAGFKNRKVPELKKIALEQNSTLDKIKWLQFMTAKQWLSLKKYCNNLGIQLIGDIPFYVSHDSADVWSHPDLFDLDKDGQMTGIAGVPPDYFSEDGQLWGMPVYHWDKLKEDNYSWWTLRLQKNLQLFDTLRLDHFRAFAEYWKVPMGENTAKNGSWVAGPGEHFFEVMKEKFGTLPFIAEDLGDNMELVYQLRDAVKLPGMRVLQFAFGENMPVSVDIPHNYMQHCVAYTGTHDNNTSQGWYQEESQKADHKRMELYLHTNVKKKNIHKIMARMVYASVANTVILPMQDILGLDASARMNTPGTAQHNWIWRLLPGTLTKDIEKQLREWVKLYNRL